MPTPRYPVDGLLKCAECNNTLHLDQAPEPNYFCSGDPEIDRPCRTPLLNAKELNLLVITDLTRRAVHSDRRAFDHEVVNNLQQAKSLAPDGAHQWNDHGFEEFITDPSWLLKPDHAIGARQLIEDAIHDIVVTTDTLTINYHGGTSTAVNTPHHQPHSVEFPASIGR